jgi:hypothetical protein
MNLTCEFTRVVVNNFLQIAISNNITKIENIVFVAIKTIHHPFTINLKIYITIGVSTTLLRFNACNIPIVSPISTFIIGVINSIRASTNLLWLPLIIKNSNAYLIGH